MCRVLIIEDDAVAALDIRSVLQSAGATEVNFAVGMKDALESARQNKPGVITCDVMLGSDFGPDVVSKVLEAVGPTPVIFITATPDECVGCPPETVLEKPFDPARLAKIFQSVMPTA